MQAPYNPYRLLDWVVPPTIGIAMGWLLLMLPSQVITFFTAWLFASFPLCVLFGHCMVNED